MVMDKKTTGIISYLSIIGWLIAYLAGDKEGAKFHLNQSLVLAIAEIALNILKAILGSIIPWPVKVVFSIVIWAANVLLLVLAILGIVSAAKEEDKPLPLIGTIKILS